MASGKHIARGMLRKSSAETFGRSGVRGSGKLAQHNPSVVPFLFLPPVISTWKIFVFWRN
jgi:hypothetical protein